MFSMCSELTPRAPIPDSRIAQFMQPCLEDKPEGQVEISWDKKNDSKGWNKPRPGPAL